MDPVHNPYAPGAGSPPPELAGRDELRRVVRIALQRIRIGNPAKSVLMVGLRGVGKTVLLEKDGYASTPKLTECTPCAWKPLRGDRCRASLASGAVALIATEPIGSGKGCGEARAQRPCGLCQGFAVTYQDIEVGLDFEPEPGLADNGDLEADLAALLEQVGIAAKEAGTAVVLFIDELQYINEAQLRL